MSLTLQEIEDLAVETLRAALARGDDPDEAARLIVKATRPWFEAGVLRNISRDGYCDNNRCEEWANAIEFRALHPRPAVAT